MQLEKPAEAADVRQDLRTTGGLDEGFDQVNETVARLNVDTGFLVSHARTVRQCLGSFFWVGQINKSPGHGMSIAKPFYGRANLPFTP